MLFCSNDNSFYEALITPGIHVRDIDSLFFIVAAHAFHSTISISLKAN